MTGTPEFLLQFFVFDHLPPHLSEISAEYGALADHIVQSLPCNEERTFALRRLLESKDCAIRSRIAGEPIPERVVVELTAVELAAVELAVVEPLPK